MTPCLIGLGANLGDRADRLRAALDRLAARPGIESLAVSRFAETLPVGGPEDQPPYLNAAATLRTGLPPESLLAALQDIEAELGRVRSERWGARTLDLDLLLYGDGMWHSPTLTVPHPRLCCRRFVLEPAAEIAADWRHPECGLTIADLLRNLARTPYYAALDWPPNTRPDWAPRWLARLAQQPGVTLLTDAATASENKAQLAAWSPVEPGWLISDFWLGLDSPLQPNFLVRFGPAFSAAPRPPVHLSDREDDAFVEMLAVLCH